MNWYKKAQVPYGLENVDSKRLNLLEASLYNCARTIESLKKHFPTAKFYTPAKQLDLFLKQDPYVWFYVLYDDVKNNLAIWKNFFTDGDRPIVSLGVEIKGFIQKNGFDYSTVGPYKQQVPNLYRMSPEGKFIPAEKTVDVINLGLIASGSENILHLIYWNSLRNIQMLHAWLKYENHPLIKQLQQHILQNGLSPSEAFKLIDSNVGQIAKNPDQAEMLSKAFGKWYWDVQSPDKRQEAMDELISNFARETQEDAQKQIEETGRDPYLFYAGMNPHEEGAGKFVDDIKNLQNALMEWGDFNVVVRYQGGRMIYPASQVVEWENAGPDDDRAYQFINQMGGIRDMFIQGKQ
jgi:hypothetical protein